MGQVISSSRFWISLVVIISVTVLAALKIISGDLAVGTMGGLVGGFGVGKTWGTPGTLKALAVPSDTGGSSDSEG